MGALAFSSIIDDIVLAGPRKMLSYKDHAKEEGCSFHRPTFWCYIAVKELGSANNTDSSFFYFTSLTPSAWVTRRKIYWKMDNTMHCGKFFT
uniref:Uncharacterized protein n=1 Tax=Pyxicephalus adspersus TaxID=30357 RepID=A0AAV3ARK7_PYXAD|nr:TPA: hypothetical protein GDO54_006198 [Pyxicephalus adspersus]